MWPKGLLRVCSSLKKSYCERLQGLTSMNLKASALQDLFTVSKLSSEQTLSLKFSFLSRFPLFVQSMTKFSILYNRRLESMKELENEAFAKAKGAVEKELQAARREKNALASQLKTYRKGLSSCRVHLRLRRKLVLRLSPRLMD